MQCNYLANISSSSWGPDRYVEENLSNHQGGEIERMVLRSHFLQKRNEISAPSDKHPCSPHPRSSRKGGVSKPRCVPNYLVQSVDFKYFLWTIPDFQEGRWYQFEPDGSCTFFVGSGHNAIPDEPKFSWGCTTANETEQSINFMWEKISSSSPQSRSVIHPN